MKGPDANLDSLEDELVELALPSCPALPLLLLLLLLLLGRSALLLLPLSPRASSRKLWAGTGSLRWLRAARRLQVGQPAVPPCPAGWPTARAARSPRADKRQDTSVWKNSTLWDTPLHATPRHLAVGFQPRPGGDAVEGGAPRQAPSASPPPRPAPFVIILAPPVPLFSVFPLPVRGSASRVGPYCV